MDAEIVVSSLIEKLQNNRSTINSQYPMLEKRLQKAIENLHLLKRYLEVAEYHEASSGHSINDQRMAQLLQAVYCTEDAADTLLTICTTEEALQIIKRENVLEKMFQWPVIMSLCNQIVFGYEVKKLRHEVRYLSSHYDFLKTSDTRSSFQNDHKGQQRWGRISDFCLVETDVVGLEEQINELVNLTLIRVNQNQPSKIIAVVGEGGSGKTTLVKAVYNRLCTEGNFTRRAWVHARSLFKARDILADILEQIDGTKPAVEATVSEEELIAMLTDTLNHTWYLIIIEDVESCQVWEAFRGFFCSLPENGRLIITTCNENFISADSTLNLRPLNKEESWQLFSKKVQIADVLNNNPEFIEFKELIQDTCGGSPLRIVLLGGLLSTKEISYDEWSRVIERAKTGDILALIYQDLPSRIKPCFLYMGLFPKGFEISVRRLIHLWVSEGFVTPLDPTAEIAAEDVAEMYFEELVVRNMIQVRWRLNYGMPETCRMPGVLYDSFSPKAADVRFFCHQLQSSDKQPQFLVRRLADCLGMKSNIRSSLLHHLRSYVAFDTRIPGIPARRISLFLDKIISKRGFGLLKVLDLEGVSKPMLVDDAIRKLLLLSYLGLRSTAIDFLPPSVGSLPCLGTLDVKHTIIYDLPTSTWKAKKLRHMYLNWSCSSNFNRSLLPSGPPSNLHTLWGLSISSEDELDFLKMLTGFRKLGLTCTSPSVAEATSEWVAQLTKLHSLKLRSIEKNSSADVLQLKLPDMGKHEKLQHLHLLGRLVKQRSLCDVELPPNLMILTLSWTGLQDDPMPVLGQLPHLNILRLFTYSYLGEELKCLHGGFPKLRVLKLWKLYSLKEWTVGEGAMPCLRELEIRLCVLLRKTTGLQHLTSLKEVELLNVRIPRSEYPQGVIIRDVFQM